MKWSDIAVIVAVPAGGAAVTPLIRGDHVKPRVGEGRHYLSPAKAEFRETVQQQYARPIVSIESALEHVHDEAIAVLDAARTYSSRETCGAIAGVHFENYRRNRPVWRSLGDAGIILPDDVQNLAAVFGDGDCAVAVAGSRRVLRRVA